MAQNTIKVSDKYLEAAMHPGLGRVLNGVHILLKLPGRKLCHQLPEWDFNLRNFKTFIFDT